MARVTAVAALFAVVVSTGLTLRAQPREFANVKQLGAALVEYHDGLTQVVAAYYYSQRNHDSPWLLIELGVSSPRTLVVRRNQVELVTPSGRTVPLAAQRRWGADSARARGLLQQASTTRHQVRTYFRGTRGVEALRFFGRPESGDTVIDTVQGAPEELLLGDLLFESPTGAWEKGAYALVIKHDTGTASLPIELR